MTSKIKSLQLELELNNDAIQLHIDSDALLAMWKNDAIPTPIKELAMMGFNGTYLHDNVSGLASTAIKGGAL